MRTLEKVENNKVRVILTIAELKELYNNRPDLFENCETFDEVLTHIIEPPIKVKYPLPQKRSVT